MGILEKLRPTPRWKHADPAVRAAAVYELGAEDADALRQLAHEDGEARVRRAAVARLDDVEALAEIARTDPDEDVRAEAIRNLTGLATEVRDAERATAVVRHLLALGRNREAVVVARDSHSADVRASVVELMTDQKSLGSISRHAPDGVTRLRALARLTDAEEIVNVALKSEQTDAAIAALERVSDADALSAIAQRARNKVASRRARTRLRQLEEEARPAPQPTVELSDDDRERATTLIARVEGLVAADPDAAAADLASARLAWAELQADV